MGLKKMFIVSSPEIANRCVDTIDMLVRQGGSWKVLITEYQTTKTQDQTDKYEAMINQIKGSGKFVFMGHSNWSRDDIKRLLIDAFARIKAGEGEPIENAGRLVPSLDGTGVVQLSVRSRDFTVKEASEFIDYLDAFAAAHDIKWIGKRWTTTS
jgi:hypothetical protein